MVLLLAMQVTGYHAQPPEAEIATTEEAAQVIPMRLAAQMDSLGIAAKDIQFVVDKSERRFDVIAGDRVLRTYPCVLGEVPEGDKMIQGDRKTPEGVFGIRSKRLHAKWHAFVWVDYPNAESRRRFAERKRNGTIPATADIGGEIGIHGVPEGMDHWIDMGADWTWGCIALKNPDLDEIFPYIQAGGTTITIVP
ncbi:MAG TPA: L,D-transpeptidase family protein [Flavobacteriales bacterium]|nr:L,D-transpeptidase family protein [Flavobacteriales bacterium]